MNHYSIKYFITTGAVLLIIVLLAGLAACALSNPGTVGTPDISAVPTVTGAAPSASVSDTPPSTSEMIPGQYTNEQITALYANSNLSVIEIRDAGAYTMVHYYSLETPDDKVSRFDWFDRKTGERELVYGWVYADKFEIMADKTLMVLTTGVSPADGSQRFPEVFTWRTGLLDGASNPAGETLDYYMPLDQSFTVGEQRYECLKSVCFDGGSMLLTFDERPGFEIEFHTVAESIPRINVTNKDGISTVTVYDTILSDDFIQTAGPMLGSDPSPVTVSCDGANTVISFRLRSSAARYNVKSLITPVDCLPHAVITYETSQYVSYPKGW